MGSEIVGNASASGALFHVANWVALFIVHLAVAFNVLVLVKAPRHQWRWQHMLFGFAGVPFLMWIDGAQLWEAWRC